MTVFAQALFGGARASRGGFGRSESQNAFALSLGGGLDVRVHDVISIRPVQAEYLLTRFDEGFAMGLPPSGSGSQQHNFRYSAGILFRFGKR